MIGSGVPGNYDDKQLDFFAQITDRSVLMRNRTYQYGDQFLKLLRPVEVTVGGNAGTLTYRTFDLTPGVALAINLTDTELIAFNNNVFSNNQQPTNAGSDEIAADIWSNCVSNFNCAPCSSSTW